MVHLAIAYTRLDPGELEEMVLNDTFVVVPAFPERLVGTISTGAAEIWTSGLTIQRSIHSTHID